MKAKVESKLPDLRQAKDHDCGPTAVRIILKYHKRSVTKTHIKELPCDPVDGTDPRAIESWFRSRDLGVLAGTMTWQDLRHLTGQGRPVICLITTSHGIGHYVVVSHTFGGYITYQCPTNGLLKVSKKEWLRGWHEVDRLGAKYIQWGIAVHRLQ